MQWLAIILLAMVLLPVVVLTTGPVRIVLGILFVLFFPGYALLAALFPRKDRPDVVGRGSPEFRAEHRPDFTNCACFELYFVGYTN